MRVCITHRDPSVITLKNIVDNAEYDLCQKCFEKILPVLTGEKNPAGRPKKEGN